MHYLGIVTEQLTHDDPSVAVARRQAQQRREARRARLQVTSGARRSWRLPRLRVGTALVRRLSVGG